MKTIISISLSLLFLSFQTDNLKADWDQFKLPDNWVISTNESTTDYFNFGNVLGQITFKNKSKAVVYYIYDISVNVKVSSGQYSAFFKDKSCQQYSSWKEGGFPNFIFNNKYYLVDLCNTSPFLSSDNEYWDLSKALFNYVNKK